MTVIIGLNALGFNTSACIMINGKILAAVEEERINREKKTRLFPEKSIEFCLKKANLKFRDIDHIAISWNPLINLEKFNKNISSNNSYLPNILHSSINYLIKNKKINKENMSTNFKVDGKEIKIHFIQHHTCHASNVFFSNYKNAAVYTVDAFGENETSTLSLYKNSKLKKINKTFFPNSLGSFYSTFTEFCGFKPQSEEWKLMGASAYFRNEKIIKKINNLVTLKKNGSFELDLNYFNHYQFHRPNYFNQKLINYIGTRPRDPYSKKMKKIYYEIAYAAQNTFEKIYFHQIKYLYKISKVKNLVIAGGCALNCLANGKIKKETGFSNIFISPVPDDSGACLGAASYLFKIILNKKNKVKLSNYYLGPSFNSTEVKKTLNKYQISYTISNNPEKSAATDIANGKVIAWFQGGLEFGDRALGNRSILADPRNPKIKDIVNLKIKFREKFRPFAPSIIENQAQNYFEDFQKSEYMELALKFKSSRKKIIPGVVHVDGTGRLQTVNLKYNQRFYKLIKEFQKISGEPMVLNTSFNVQGEPMVCSIDDAIKNFYLSGLDKLFICDIEITK